MVHYYNDLSHNDLSHNDAIIFFSKCALVEHTELHVRSCEMMIFLLQPYSNFIADHEPYDLFSSKGEAWRTVRRILSPSFSASKMKMVIFYF